MADTNGTPAAAAEQLYELKVDGQVLREPLPRVIERAQKSAAVERRLEEVSKMRNDLQSAQQIHAQDLQFSQRFREMMARDPKGLRAEVDRMVRLAEGGEPASTDTEHSTDGTPQQPQGHRGDPALEAKLRELEGMVRHLSAESTVDRLGRDIAKELDAYPLFQDRASPVSQEAREQAEFLVRALKASPDSANIPTTDLVARVHTRMHNLLNGRAQVTHDTRVATAAAVPAVAAQSGTPALNTSAPETPNASWMANKGVKARDFLSQLARGIAPTR